MRVSWNPLLYRQMKQYAGSGRVMAGLLAYEICLAVVSAAGFGMVFRTSWADTIEFSGMAYVYLILAGMQSILVMLMVPSLAAQSIAMEWERQTMEILLTTAVKPVQIVVGKLYGVVSLACLFVVAGMPFLAVVFTLGGVEKIHLLQFFAILFVEAVFLGGIGIALSTIMKKTDIAGMWSYLSTLLLCLGDLAVLAGIYLLRSAMHADVMRMGGMADVAALGLLLLNPLVTMAVLLCGQLGYTGEIFALLQLLGPVPDGLRQSWCVASVCLQLLLALCFLGMAMRSLKNAGFPTE